MKKVIFFTENEWAFGQIHYSLSRHILQYGIIADVLNFFKTYQMEEMRRIDKNTDLYVTTPVGAVWLVNYYNIPKEKIYCVVHAKWDHFLGNKLLREIGVSFDYCNVFPKFGFVSNYLCTELGFNKNKANILPLGIETALYSSNGIYSKSIKKIGYAGSLESYNFFGSEIKRGYVVKNVCEKLNLEFVIPGTEKYNYLSMPEFYRNVDCVVVSSLEEGFGLPILESAASGTIVISTKVGINHDIHYSKDCLLNPIYNLSSEETEEDLIKILRFLIDQKETFIEEKGKEFETFIKQRYDWKHVIENWVDFILQ